MGIGLYSVYRRHGDRIILSIQRTQGKEFIQCTEDTGIGIFSVYRGYRGKDILSLKRTGDKNILSEQRTEE